MTHERKHFQPDSLFASCEEEEQAWDETFSQPQVQAALSRMADEARRQYHEGETEDGGFDCEEASA